MAVPHLPGVKCVGHDTQFQQIAMTHGHTRIPSRAKCIYCGETGVPLTDEHVVPLSLGGQHILEKASCTRCADITKKFEQHVAREMWGDARIAYDAPTRRRKARPTHIVLSDPSNRDKKVRVPYSDYAPPIVFYKMPMAGLLASVPETLDISSSWHLVEIHDDAKAKAFERKYGMKMVAKVRHMPESFGRLMAKVGYCHILTEIEPSDFDPICLPYILGEKRNVSFVVGGSLDIPPADAGLGYKLSTRLFGDQHRLLVLAEVRLFASNMTPIYHVVVGEALGPERTMAVLRKYGAGAEIEPAGGLSGNREHWEPKSWPLVSTTR